jgi:hypothetical protein
MSIRWAAFPVKRETRRKKQHEVGYADAKYYLFVVVLVDFVPEELTHGPGSYTSPMLFDHHLPNNISKNIMNA